jgi:hypothetical protein
MKALACIESYNIPTSTFGRATHELTLVGDLGERMYRERIGEMGNFPDQTNLVIEMLPLVYGYMVQEAVRTPTLDGRELYEYAVQRAQTFVNANRYVLAKDPTTGGTGVSAGGKTKKDQADDVVVKFKDDGVVRGRGEWIALLMQHVDLTPGSASSNYATLKHKYKL